MSQATYKTAIEFVLKWEVGNKPNGGYTNDPNDPGGETKWGVAKRYHPKEDIKNLTLERAMQIYREEYWDVYKKNNLDLDTSLPELAVAVFDSGVNCGVGRSFTWYNQSLKAKEPVIEMLALRTNFYYTRPADWQARYLKGVINRMNDLKKLVEIIQQDAALS